MSCAEKDAPPLRSVSSVTPCRMEPWNFAFGVLDAVQDSGMQIAMSKTMSSETQADLRGMTDIFNSSSEDEWKNEQVKR